METRDKYTGWSKSDIILEILRLVGEYLFRCTVSFYAFSLVTYVVCYAVDSRFTFWKALGVWIGVLVIRPLVAHIIRSSSND